MFPQLLLLALFYRSVFYAHYKLGRILQVLVE